MSEGSGESSNEVPVGSKAKKSKKTLVIAVVAIVIVAIVLLAVVMSPQYSPLSSIHDADDDGVADKNDAFPNDPDEWLDTDEDGVGDNADAFPTDSTQWADRDGDSYGDNPLGINPDAFPDDPTEWRDSDSDGVGDNADFYDLGNGKVEIAVDNYQGDGTADFWTYGDPFFVIGLDTGNDGVFDATYTSSIFTDTELLTSPYSVTVDIAEDTAAFRFQIIVYDSDLEGNYVIDYAPSSTGTYMVHTVYSPFAGDWSYNGSDDGLSETDCILEYSLTVTS